MGKIRKKKKFINLDIKNTASITCGMNTDRSSRFTYVKLLFINNPTPPRPSSVSV